MKAAPEKPRPRNPYLDAFMSSATAAGCPWRQAVGFANAGVILTPKQLLCSAAARLCDARGGPTEVGVGGARGGGKSFWLLAQMAVDDALRMPGYKGLFLRRIGKAAAESIMDLARAVLKRVPHVVTARGHIELPNGSRILAGHFRNENDIDAYLGLEYDGIGVEEATTLSRTKLEAVKTVCRTSKPGWRPRMYYSTNPGGVSHGFFKRKFVEPFRSGAETETRFIPFTVEDNPFTNPEYRQTLDNLTGWLKRAWRYGDWDISAGQFFDTFSARHHVYPFFVSKQVGDGGLVPETWFASLDYGFSHYTYVALGFRTSDGRYFVVDEHSKRRWLVRMHAAAVLAMLRRHDLAPGDLRHVAAGPDAFSRDKAGETVAEDYAKHGLTLTPAVADRKAGWARVLSLLGDPDHGQPARLFVHPRCAHLIRTLPEMQHDPADPEDVLKVDVEEDGEGGDDPPDGLRYLVATRVVVSRVVKVRGL